MVLEEIAARIAAYWLQKTGLRKVVLAGGVAAPLRGLAGSMNNMITGLARSLAAVQSQKASEG